MTQQKVTTSIQAYITPILLSVCAYLINDRLVMIDARLERLESKAEVTIELKGRIDAIEKRVMLERVPAKKEEDITIK